jgi:hypothetical protein
VDATQTAIRLSPSQLTGRCEVKILAVSSLRAPGKPKATRMRVGEHPFVQFSLTRNKENSMPDQLSLVYIPCEIKAGMFSTEYTVTVRDLSGETISFFADRGLVRDGQPPLLRVHFLGADERPEPVAVVLLPGSAMDADRRYVSVRQDEVVAA